MSRGIGSWHSLLRSITRGRNAGGTASDVGTANDVRQYGVMRAFARAIGGRVHAFFGATGQRVQQAQANRAHLWVEARRNERRANRRALMLLLKLLNPDQRQEFRKFGYFHVTGGDSRTRYRIRAATIGNIDVLCDNGRIKYRLCIAPTGEVPVYDVMAAQLLHLQDALAEERLRQQAKILPALAEDCLCSRPPWVA